MICGIIILAKFLYGNVGGNYSKMQTAFPCTQGLPEIRENIFMQKIKFQYDEPRYGDIEIDGPDMVEEDILRLIEEQYPEAINVEILETEIING